MRAMRAAVPELVIATDVCLCQYTDHGHCGVLHDDGTIANDETLPLLARVGVSHARAGADLISPSDMMDGRVAAIRAALDDGRLRRAGGDHELLDEVRVGVLRARSATPPTRRRSGATARATRWIPANAREALHDSLLDEAEGADLLMVKPAGPYLDVITRLVAATNLPVAAYQVSGEHAAIRFAAQHGALDLRQATLESLIAIRRAGAQVIMTYSAIDVAEWLQ